MLTADFQFSALKTCLFEQAQRADAEPSHKVLHPAQSGAQLCLPRSLQPFQGARLRSPNFAAQQLRGLVTGLLESPQLNPPGSGDLLLSMLLTDASV